MTELAADGIPVTVTCRVLKICRQDYYRWLNHPVTDALLDEAYLTNAIFDPEFGYRFLADEIRSVGFEACDRTVWRICRDNGWSSVFGKKKGKKSKPGAPAHDDLVKRDFTAAGPDELCSTDIERHEAFLNLAVVKGHRHASVAADVLKLRAA